MRVELAADGATTRARILGTIDADANLAPLLEQHSAVLLLDLSGVQMITSAGVILWLRFVKSLPRGLKVKLEGCPVTFVNQAGLIPGFLGLAEMETLFVPYLCPSCDHAENALTKTTDISLAASTPRACPRCGHQMELDVVEEQYFSFLQD